ncbi:MAG: anti-phage defense ZorAB system ZorA [Xanthomonadales bacterium]|nr:anti-phage defense ZorAB system ZorA [Xanthomonadales bacterium]
MSEFLSHIVDSWLMLALTVICVLLLVDFLNRYMGRGVVLLRQLKHLAGEVSALDVRAQDGLRDRLAKLFMDSKFAHAWSEFEETLHDQRKLVNGRMQTVAVRATAPAESFLHVDSVIDPVIHTEYFKHLPGIFTGLGIIGTFVGLISGLMAFEPTGDANQLKDSLGPLFTHVQNAFFFSATAIGLAMAVTVVEKILFAACTYRLGRLTEALDRLFRAGVGEDYLSDLVRASQDNATQTRQLKESLVEDLKAMLTNLSDAQVGATQQMAADIGRSIEGSLKEPLAHIADTVRQASGQQTSAASHALESLMSAFIAQMKETVGGQLGDMGQLLQQTTASLSTVESTLRALVGDMRASNAEASEELRAAVNSLLSSIASQQREHSTAAAEGMQQLLAGVDGAVRRIEERQQALAEQLTESMERVTAAMEGRIATLADSNREVTGATQEAVTAFGKVSLEAIEGMQQSARSMSEAGAAAARSLEGMGRVLERLDSLHASLTATTQRMNESATVLGSTSNTLSTGVRSLESASSKLESVARSAATEAETRSALLRELSSLQSEAQKAALEFAALAEDARGGLSQSVEDFAGNLSKTMALHLGEYQKQLGAAISMLKSAFEDLAAVASEGGR